jgi:WD40 repeat protein
MVLTGGDDMKVHTWSATTGQPLESFSGHKGAVKALVFNGEKFISASADRTARVWSPGIEWKLERTLGTGDINSPLTDRVNTIDFSPDGKQIATGSGEPSRGGEVQIWNIADGKLAKNFAEVHSDSVLGLEFSKDGKYIASASADKFVKVTDIATGKVIHNFEGHTHHALGVSWLPHGRQLVSVGADKSIRHWNFEQGERIRQRTNIGKEVTSIHYVGLTEQAVVTAGDKSVRLINTSNLNDARSYSGGTDFMYACAATPDAKIILAGGEDSALRVWNMTNGKVIVTFEAPKLPEENKPEEKK